MLAQILRSITILHRLFLLEQIFKPHTAAVKKTFLTIHTSRRIQIEKYGEQTTVYEITVS